MRKSFKIIKINLIAICSSLIFSFLAFGKTGPVALVNKVKGNAFSVSEGVTSKVRIGDQLNHSSELILEVGAQITFTDHFDHQFHLAGSGHIKFLDRIIELKQGYIWVQSYNENNIPYGIKTANAVSSYTKGEGIVSFDSYSGKTQVLVVKGTFSLAGLLEKEFIRFISDGQFSFVHDKYEEGLPRAPTPIGFSSYKKSLALFEGINPIGEKSEKTVLQSGRQLASVKELNVPKVSGEKKLMDHYLSKVDSPIKKEEITQKKKNTPRSTFGAARKSNVKIHIFGMKSRPLQKNHRTHVEVVRKKRTYTKKVTRNRIPASAPTYKNHSGRKSSDLFEKALNREYQKQRRHSDEVESLMHDLKSYNKDSGKGY